MELFIYLFFQAYGENRISIGTNSNLPNSIANDRIRVEKSEYGEKLPNAPNSPNAGPMLFTQEMAAVKVVSILIPSSEIASIVTIVTMM